METKRFKKGDRVISNVLNGKDETFTVVRIDECAQALNVLCKADYDDLEIWITGATLVKVEY